MATAEQKGGSVLRRAAGATVYYGLGRVLPKVAGFLLIPLYASFLSPADYGVLELAAISVEVLAILMRLGVPGAVSRFYYEHREGPELQDYLTTIWWFQTVCTVLVSGVTLALWPLFAPGLLNDLPMSPFGVLVVCTAALLGATDIQRRVIQVREQARYSAHLSWVMALVHIALALLFVAVFRWGVYGMMWATVLGNAVGFVQARYYFRADVKGRFRWPLLKDSLGYATGILPNQLIAQVAPLGNRALLTSLHGLSSLGLLGIASRFVSPLTILIQAFSSAFLPIYFSLRKESTQEAHDRIVTLTTVAWSFVLLVALSIVMLGPPVVALILPASFQEAGALIPWVALGGLAEFIYVLVSPEIFYARKSRLPIVVSITTAVFSLGATALLAKPYGPAGVAAANMVALTASSIVGALLTRGMVPFRLPWSALAVSTLFALMVAASSWFTAGSAPLTRLMIHTALLVCFVGLLFARKDPLIHEVRKRFGLAAPSAS